MADKLEKDLLAQETITMDDFVRMLDDSGVSYKNPIVDVAQAIIESYDGSELAGSEVSVKSAIDTLKTLHETLSGTVTGHTTSIAGIESRICTSAELTALEEALDIE